MTRVRCCLCGQIFSERDPQPIGDEGARFFHKPAESYVCFWCMDAMDYDPSDPVPSRFPAGRG